MPLMLFDVRATFPKGDTRHGSAIVFSDVQAATAGQAVLVVRWRNPRVLAAAELKAVRPRFAVVTHA